MHQSSIWHMKDCLNRHIVNRRSSGRVLEIGSGVGRAESIPAYKKMFLELGWEYDGLDLNSGHNVDIVAADPFIWPIATNSYDAVISGQMLEHNTAFWLTFLEMARVLKSDGIMIHIAPSRGYEHKVPTDCWRFYRDSMNALADWCGLECIEATTDWSQVDLNFQKEKKPHIYNSIPRKGKFAEGTWGDTVGVFSKPANWSPNIALKYMNLYIERIQKM